MNNLDGLDDQISSLTRRYFKDDGDSETKSKDEMCNWSDSGHGTTARNDADFEIPQGSRSPLQVEITSLESEVKYGWSGESVTFDPGGPLVDKRLFRNGIRSPQPVDDVPSESAARYGWSGENVTFDPGGPHVGRRLFQNGIRSPLTVDDVSSESEAICGWSGERVTFDPGGQNPVDPNFFQHDNRSFQRVSCDASDIDARWSDASTWHENVDCIGGKPSTQQKENLAHVHLFQPRNLARNGRSRFPDKGLQIPATTGFEESDLTQEKGLGFLDLCYYVTGVVFVAFGNDLDADHHVHELKSLRIKHGVDGDGCWESFRRNFWTNDFSLYGYDTRSINMGWDVAFIFEMEESPFVYNALGFEFKDFECLRKRRKRDCVKISSGVFALEDSFALSHRFVPLAMRFGFDIKSVRCAKTHVEASCGAKTGQSHLVCQKVFFDTVKACKRSSLNRSHFKCPYLPRTTMRLAVPFELSNEFCSPSQITTVDETCVSVPRSVKQVIDWRELLSVIAYSGYRRICCVSDSDEGEGIVKRLRYGLKKYDCQVLNIDDSRCGLPELCSIEECLFSCDCFVVVLTQQNVSRKVAFIVNTIIASGKLNLYSIVNSCSLIKYLPCLLKPFPIITLDTASTTGEIKSFRHKASYCIHRLFSNDELSMICTKLLSSSSGDRIRVLMDEDDFDANETIRRVLSSSRYVINDDDIQGGKPIFGELARELYADRMFVIIPASSDPSPVYRYALRVLSDRTGLRFGEIPHCSALLLTF